MTFLQPGTNFVMKEGIVPLFDDPLADEVRLAMPACLDVHVMFGGRLRIGSMRSLAGIAKTA